MKLDIKNIYDWPLSTKLIFILILMILVIIVGYWFDLSSLSGDISDAKKQEDDLKTQLESSINKEKKLTQELDQFNQVQALLDRWKKKIIVHTQVPQLLNEILKIGSNNHLNFVLFNPEQEVVDGIYRRLPIKIIAVGSYHQIGDFLSQIANMPVIVMIDEFTISNENREEVLGTKMAKEAKAGNLLTAELTLNIYHYPDPNELVIIQNQKEGAAAPGTPGAQPAQTPGAAATPATPAAAAPATPATPAAPASTPTPTPTQGDTANAPKT